MAQLNALQLAETLQKRLIDFSIDDSFVQDKALSEICRRLWANQPDRGGLLSDLWVEGNSPAENSDKSLLDLVQEEVFDAELCHQLNRTGAVPEKRPLYTHQYEALRIAQGLEEDEKKPSLVITAGTGAGKTEAFLLPILNDLYTNKDDNPGVKCIILYPMNALVNDQVERLYGWLQGQTKVRLLHFTSETPENKRWADRDGVPEWDACRIRTRQEARGLEDPKTGKKYGTQRLDQIPDILITNYSMLEYMLCRPQDAVFFGSALRAIVVDEAHLYTGTLAAEITLLLRRLGARCGISSNDIFQVATSATLGTGDRTALRDFASTLFSKDSKLVHVIEGRSVRVSLSPPAPPSKEPTASEIIERVWLDKPLIRADEFGDLTLSKDEEMSNRLRDGLQLLVSNDILQEQTQEIYPAKLLRNTLSASPLIHKMEDVLWHRERIPLHELAKIMWNDSNLESVRATISLLQLSASARHDPTEYPLIPHRVHLMVRSSDGLVLCLDSNCSGATEFKLEPFGTISTGFHDHCPECEGAVLTLYRCQNCGEWGLAAQREGNKLIPILPGSDEESVMFAPGHILGHKSCSIDVRTGTLHPSGTPFSLLTQCIRCGEDLSEYKQFSSHSSLFLSILAETVLAEIPPFPSYGNDFLPARGRRMLAFSDSRREAARLGPRLTRQHEIQLIRAAIFKSIIEMPLIDKDTLKFYKSSIQNYESQLSNPNLTAPHENSIKQQIQHLQQQFKDASVGGSIEQWCQTLSRQPLLAELLDRDTAADHLAKYKTDKGYRSWSQSDWDKNWGHIKKLALIYLAREFSRPSRRVNSLETLGLVEVTYPGLDDIEVPKNLLGILPSEEIRQSLKECWPEFLATMCDTLRSDGAITLKNYDESALEQLSVTYIGKWCTSHGTSHSYQVNFVGATTRQRRRRFVISFLQACGINYEEAQDLSVEILNAVFDLFLERATPQGQKPGTDELPWLEKHVRQSSDGPPRDSIRLKFDHLGLRRPLHIFRCEQTGHIWYRSVLACALETDRIRTLKPIGEEDMDTDPRIGRQRREYQESKVFEIGLWAEEHSAQLSPKENRRLQDLFKVGIRNILSATTTLELGIDIGGLNAVLMSNVPPGKANYLQRAGRAGRRSDGSSAVITFSRPQPYDREVFHRIGNYLDRPLRRPIVFLDRRRVVRRHLQSYFLGEFFKAIYPADLHVGAMKAFGDMGLFCGVVLPPYWKPGTEKPSVSQVSVSNLDIPLDLPWWNPGLQTPGLEAQFLSFLYWIRDWGEYDYSPIAQTLLSGSPVIEELDHWYNFIQGIIDNFSLAIQSWRNEYENLLLTWYMDEENNNAQANAIRYQLRALYEITVIEALADRQFLPHYGFPIGVHKLRVISPDADNPNKIRDEDQYRLDRGGLLALREYVPGSQLLVGGKLISSRGLLKHWTGANLDTYIGLRGQSCRCKNGHFYYWISKAVAHCPICGAAPKENPSQLLFPKHGFSGAAWDPPKWSTDIELVGSAQTATITFTQHFQESDLLVEENVGDIEGLRGLYRENGELLVYNRGAKNRGFAICLKCGYAESEVDHGNGSMNLPAGFDTHAPLTSTKPWARCSRDGNALNIRNQILAARETTDVLMIDFSKCLGSLGDNEPLVTTLGYALQRAGAQILELDSREIGVMIAPAGDEGRALGAILYDSVAGGAGHVRELLGKGRLWLEEARQVLFVNEEHHNRCKTACLDCLLSFDAQQAMRMNLFNRRLAFSVLDTLLKGETYNYTPEHPKIIASKSPAEGQSVLTQDRQELLAKAREKLKNQDK